jgi:hypothetical protein
MTSFNIAILDIIVQQRKIMEEFQRSRSRQRTYEMRETVTLTRQTSSTSRLVSQQK